MLAAGHGRRTGRNGAILSRWEGLGRGPATCHGCCGAPCGGSAPVRSFSRARLVLCFPLLMVGALHKLARRGLGEKRRDLLALMGLGRGAANSRASRGARRHFCAQPTPASWSWRSRCWPADARCGALGAHSAQRRDSFALGRPWAWLDDTTAPSALPAAVLRPKPSWRATPGRCSRAAIWQGTAQASRGVKPTAEQHLFPLARERSCGGQGCIGSAALYACCLAANAGAGLLIQGHGQAPPSILRGASPPRLPPWGSTGHTTVNERSRAGGQRERPIVAAAKGEQPSARRDDRPRVMSCRGRAAVSLYRVWADRPSHNRATETAP